MLNFSLALLEIGRRNEIRREAGLPLLSVTRESRRVKKREDAHEFEQFAAAHEKAVWEQLLKASREAKGDPKWRPNSLQGMAYQPEKVMPYFKPGKEMLGRLNVIANRS